MLRLQLCGAIPQLRLTRVETNALLRRRLWRVGARKNQGIFKVTGQLHLQCQRVLIRDKAEGGCRVKEHSCFWRLQLQDSNLHHLGTTSKRLCPPSSRPAADGNNCHLREHVQEALQGVCSCSPWVPDIHYTSGNQLEASMLEIARVWNTRWILRPNKFPEM